LLRNVNYALFFTFTLLFIDLTLSADRSNNQEHSNAEHADGEGTEEVIHGVTFRRWVVSYGL
jgi:hypothetical protein